ncbi:TrmH family RNA methyltransferase [Vogesella indigofera]|uniref:TrmH family RNA methyltransferase n=1 Tax=Vogesella indigofera TaxID=45465 RepID=UPI00234ED35F|nr:RNA methyltransferase [Vogesella indigofera]MDC7712437.1 RNA methyltransferase [Vogesella indigofera]
MTFHKIITSAANDEMKSLARLLDNARERRKQQLLVLEGLHLLQAALDAGLPLHAVYVNEAAQQHPEWLALHSRIDRAVPCSLVSTAVLAKVTALATPAEVLVLCPRPQGSAAQQEAAVLLDDVQDPGNMGTILRCAAAANVRQVYLSKGCVDVYSPKVLRAGMGAHFVLQIHEQADLAAELVRWPGARLATHLEGSVSLYSEDLRGAVAFVFGNEGKGVSAPVLAACDRRVRIPMPGHAESLNVAMAATVCLFERVRQGEAAAPGAA